MSNEHIETLRALAAIGPDAIKAALDSRDAVVEQYRKDHGFKLDHPILLTYQAYMAEDDGQHLVFRDGIEVFIRNRGYARTVCAYFNDEVAT